MANFTIPKIKLGSEKKPMQSINLSHDVSTTAEFCFCQPLMCRELVPDSVLKTKVSSVVRLTPLQAPSYGVVTYNTYHRFVPVTEIMPQFEYMLAGKPYYTKQSNYVPSGVVRTSVQQLTLVLLEFAYFEVYKRTGGTGSITTGEIYKRMDYSSSDTDLPNAITAYNNHFFQANTTGLGRLDISRHWSSVGQATLDIDDTLPHITPQGADFVLEYDNKLYCFRFNKNGLRLRKILLGLGYQVNISDTSEVSLLPLFAYFKAWYDLFAPQQTSTWTGTACYNLIDRAREDNWNSIDICGSTQSGYWRPFFNELLNCWYVSSPDYVSAHIANPAISNITASLDANQPTGFNTIAVSASANAQSTVNIVNSSNPLTKIRLDLMLKLAKWTNKNTVIGGKIRDYLRVHFGADFMEDKNSNHIGSNVVLCEIDPVISQAATTEATLGEYAGAGIGKDEGQMMTFKADTFGYWITLAAVVPASSGYAQGVSPQLFHKDRFSFYNPEFDAVGFEITTKDQIFGSCDVQLVGQDSPNLSFGLIPRYSSYKVAQNVVNGCISLRSTRDKYLPYTLDRFITPGELLEKEHSSAPGTFDVVGYVPTIPIASEEYRYLGKYAWLGNFDRIFVNEGYDGVEYPYNDLWNPIADNFIIHNFFNCTLIAPMLSMSESFDTDEMANNTISVEKA